MMDENYSSFTKTGPNNGNYKPDEHENHSRKERKRGKGSESERKKRLVTLVFSFYSVDFGDSFSTTKNQCRRSH